jgi:hypothetical protein
VDETAARTLLQRLGAFWILEAGISDRFSVGGEAAYNFQSHSLRAEGFGFINHETAQSNWVPLALAFY